MFEEHITPGHLSSTHSILDIGHTEYQQTEIQHQFSLQYLPFLNIISYQKTTVRFWVELPLYVERFRGKNQENINKCILS